jgi:adenylate cyclase
MLSVGRAMERKLTAILAADVVGYSALMERNEADAARAAAARLLEVAPGWTISGFVKMDLIRPQLMQEFAAALRKAGLPE